MVMHLSAAPGRKLRVATYGLGVWQTDMVGAVSTAENAFKPSVRLSPNPVGGEQVTLSLDLPATTRLSWQMLDVKGRTLRSGALREWPAGRHDVPLPLDNLPAGAYAVVVEGASGGKNIRLAKVFQKM